MTSADDDLQTAAEHLAKACGGEPDDYLDLIRQLRQAPLDLVDITTYGDMPNHVFLDLITSHTFTITPEDHA